jgi:hypothetical protein
MGRGDRKIVREAKDRQRKHKARESRAAVERGQARKAAKKR